MAAKATSRAARERRRFRVRKKVMGTAERPRINVFRSLNHIYAQVIDDDRGVTLCAASTQSPELSDKLGSGGGTVEAAKAVGELIARKALEKGITKVVFDRAGYLYHGRVKAVADGARAGGLDF